MLELTKDFVDALRLQIEAGRDEELANKVGELHPKDVADIFDALRREEILYLYRLLGPDFKSEVIAELEEDVREELLSSLSSKEIAEDVIEGLDSDDAADALADLPEAKVEEAMRMVDDVESASEVLELLSYDEGTAGAMMAVELVKVEEDWTVARAIREIRAQASDVENIYTIYMVDDQGRLNGRLSLKSLLLNASSAKLDAMLSPRNGNVFTMASAKTWSGMHTPPSTHDACTSGSFAVAMVVVPPPIEQPRMPI